MAKKKKGDDKPGYGKLLDAWVAPDHAGDPVGAIATSFTFSPVFFEEECLARFLQLESDPTEDGPVYLVEREEKLAQLSCAAALVDQHHCRGGRSLRWDLLSARMPKGLQHAKVCLLYWSNLVRLIIGSANLTEDGYRRNLEVYGILDFQVDGEAPVSCLLNTVEFLRQASEYSAVNEVSNPPLDRWNALLDRVVRDCSNWGVTDDVARRAGIQVRPVFSGPGQKAVFAVLKEMWPGGSPPDVACVVSPFFDPPEADNAPAHELWNLLRQRGEASVEFHVSGEEVPGEDGLFLNAPESLLKAQPQGRSSISTAFHRVIVPDGRSLHAKGVWLENPRWSVYLIGSSNFTSAGTGLSKNPNLEANLSYIVDTNRVPNARKVLDNTFPESELVDFEAGVKWKPLTGEGEDGVGEEVLLPSCFGTATYDCDDKQRATIRLAIDGTPPDGWELITDGDEQRFWGEQEWLSLQSPGECVIDWKPERPPAGFWVRWQDSKAAAWWPVNVTAGEVLPPPDELKHLPLEILINILSSARPLHRVLKGYLKRRKKHNGDGGDGVLVDPHKRVDTSQFLLQRTRRISWALNALRKRLERPVVTIAFLRWRLRGPVGVTALAEALVREARSEEEKAFLISELVLELARTKPEAKEGCVSPELHQQEIREVITDLRKLVPEIGEDAPENLRRYVETVFEAVSS
jgi:hypothetical protein